MIEAVFVFIVYLIITVIIFINTRFKIISGQELELLYNQAYNSFLSTQDQTDQAETQTSQSNIVVANAADLLNEYTNDGLENENSLNTDTLSSLRNQTNQTNQTQQSPYREILRTGLQAVVDLETTTPYRNWYMTDINGFEIFAGSKQLQFETDDGTELFIKVRDGDGYRYLGVNFFNAIESFYQGNTRPSSLRGFYMFFETINSKDENAKPGTPLKVRLSTSKYLKATSKLLTKELNFKKINEFSDTADVNDTVFLLSTETERNEIGTLVPLNTPNADNTRFIIKSTSDHIIYYDVEMEIPSSDDDIRKTVGDFIFYIKNNKGLYMTVNTDYFDVDRGKITFTTIGTPLYLISDTEDPYSYRITTRSDSFGLFLTIFNTFNLYNRDGDVATLDNTKFNFYIINNSYTRPYYYPECDTSNRNAEDIEIWNEKCHMKCTSITSTNPVDPRGDQSQWFREYTTDSDGNITGGLCKRYGECPKGYYKMGAMCYEDCRMKGPGWFNGSLLECAHCGSWKSDGALGCTPNGGAAVSSFLATVFTAGLYRQWKPWENRSSRKTKTIFNSGAASGAMNQISDIVDTETGKDGIWTSINRTLPAQDVICKNGGELVYIDASGVEHDKNSINLASNTYTLMCKGSCYNNLYTDDTTDDTTCVRANFNTASIENF